MITIARVRVAVEATSLDWEDSEKDQELCVFFLYFCWLAKVVDLAFATNVGNILE